MDNIITFANKNANKSFSDLPFGAVDSLILSKLAYFCFERVVSSVVDEEQRYLSFAQISQLISPEDLVKGISERSDSKKLWAAVVEAPRYRDIVTAYCEADFDVQEQKQFFGIVFIFPQGGNYVAFRGTDNSFIGWKEDFNMAFLSVIPSQADAVQYLSNVAPRLEGELIIGGHSKGGNLAVYSSVNCECALRERITAIYNHDGPGFPEEFYSQEGYLQLQDVIYKTIPQASVVGMIMEYNQHYKVVRSNRIIGITQHNPFSWEVKGDDFHYIPNVADTSLTLNRAILNWLRETESSARQAFVDMVYGIIITSEAHTLEELTNNWGRSASRIFRTTQQVDKEKKSFIKFTISSMIKTYSDTVKLDKEQKRQAQLQARKAREAEKAAKREAENLEKALADSGGALAAEGGAANAEEGQNDMPNVETLTEGVACFFGEEHEAFIDASIEEGFAVQLTAAESESELISHGEEDD